MPVGQTMVGSNPAVQNIKHVLLSVVDARMPTVLVFSFSYQSSITWEEP
jgi:hypothetical protein